MRAGAPLRIGLTGGIASGKSTVAAMFAELGVPVIDTDVLAREVVAPGQPALARLVAEFGPGILAADGSLDRARMRERVFADDAERARLEAIVHPAVREAMVDRAARAGGAYQILVVPLLLETGMTGLVDRVLVIDCPREVQLERLRRRDGEDRAGAERLLAAQMDREERLSRADDILQNDGELESLRHAVERLHGFYVAAARGEHCL